MKQYAFQALRDSRTLYVGILLTFLYVFEA